jgi:predicted membrane-bound dolichyl-phosphate-mannose-protein mannosyltransferase
MRWQYLGLCVIVLAVLALHLTTIMRPADLVFDENHYIVEARGIMAGWGPLYTEHPPLGKLLIISGIRLLGDNPVGWRLFPVLFGTAGIILFYFICGSLNMPRRTQLLATFLFGFENLSFLQAGLAMLDVYSVTLMLTAFLLCLRGKQLSSGLCVGLSTLVKLTGVLAFPAIFLHWLFSSRKRVQWLLVLAFATIISFLLFYPLLDFALSHTLSNPIALIKESFSRSSGITLSTGYSEVASRPWEWLLSLQAWFYTYDPQYIAVITPTIWVLIIPSVLYMLFRAIRGNGASLFGLSWFASAYLPLIALSLILDRVTYLYYLYPAVGAVCIGLGLGLAHLLELGKNQGRNLARRMAIGVTTGYLVLHVIFFVVLSPFFLPLVRWFPIPP